MTTKIFTLNFLLGCMLTISLNAQTTFNVPDDGQPLNEFINEKNDTVKGSTYILERDGIYIMSGAINTLGDVTIKAADGAGKRPYIVVDVNESGEPVTWQMQGWGVTGSLTLQSLHINNSDLAGNRGAWYHGGFFFAGGDLDVTIDDCILDFFDGNILGLEASAVNNLKMTNNLVRFSGYAGAGPWQGFGAIIKNGENESIYIENNTFVEGIAPILVFENGFLGDFWFNHNTIVNHAQFPIRAEYWTEAAFMNNLFVNGHFAGQSADLRTNQDCENLPYGMINACAYKNDTLEPAGFPAEDDRVLVMAYNNNYVSSGVKAFWNNPGSFLKTDTASGGLGWQYTDFNDGTNGFVNSRVKAMLKDDAKYPAWLWHDSLIALTHKPDFTKYTWEDAQLVAFAKKMNGDTTAVVTVGSGDFTVHPDTSKTQQPVDPDLFNFGYTNQILKELGHLGYPVGDLNWFPAMKAKWEADANRETFAAITSAAKAGTFEYKYWPDIITGIATKNALEANISDVYPNPANDMATITINLSSSELVSIKLYNVYGQEVMTVMDSEVVAGTRKVNFSVSELSSGTYIYQVTISGNTISKKLSVL